MSELPVGAILASALMAANYPGDSGEDVDRLIAELGKRGVRITEAAAAAPQPEIDVERLATAMWQEDQREGRGFPTVEAQAEWIAAEYAALSRQEKETA
jgi:hypothetical protein